MTTSSAHNFFHQKDNFRRYYFDLSSSSSTDLRISHVLSHYIYTNTLLDYEITFAEPMFQFLPIQTKSYVKRYGPLVYHILLYLLFLPMDLLNRLILLLKGKRKFKLENFLPILELLIMIVISSEDFTLTLW